MAEAADGACASVSPNELGEGNRYHATAQERMVNHAQSYFIRRALWEARLAYYDRALLNYLAWIEGTMSSMKVDGISEVVEHFAKALLEIEDAWSMLALEKTSFIIASKKQGEPRGTEGATK